MELNEKALEYVRKIALISNTPAFLYNRVLRSDYTVELAAKNDAQILFEEIKAISSKGKRMPFDSAAAHTLIIALSLKDDFDPTLLRQVDLSWVDWAEDLISIISMKNETRTFSEAEPNSLQYTPDAISSALSSTNVFNFNACDFRRNVD